MDKKVLVSLLNSIVTEVAEKNGLDESEARTFVGVALKRQRAAFVASIASPTQEPQPQQAV